MHRFVLALLAVLCFSLVAIADAPVAKLSAQALAAKIDQFITARWNEAKVTPAPLADDAEFSRRLHLDLIGRIPDILAARDFIDNPARDKRARLVEQLLSSNRYPTHWANVWRSWILPETNQQVISFAVPGTFENWMMEELKKNTPYDRLVSSLLTYNSGAVGATLFYQSHQGKPENLAAATSQLFLGIKLECAQCHHHPFARWKRQQFWELAAFFNSPGNPFVRTRSGLAPPNPTATGTITIPGTDKVVKARMLDGKEPASTGDVRAELVKWMIAKENPYFARAAVNRLWEYLFGTGLVEPVDEEAPDNPPSHPELLKLLADQFAANDYDLKYLLQAMTLSQAYQRSSRLTHSSQADPRVFARMRSRGLSPQQLYDSLILATGNKEEELTPITPFGRRTRFNMNSPRADFIRRFPAPEKRSEQPTSILQALYLMNGKIVADATSLEHNKNLAIIAEARRVPTPRRVQQLFLITLARKPTRAESDRLVKYVDGGGPTGDSARALCDVFWALLNSSEFSVNH